MPPMLDSDRDSDSEERSFQKKTQKPKPKPKPKQKRKKAAADSDSDSDEPTIQTKPTPKPKPKTKQKCTESSTPKIKRIKKPSSEEDTDNETNKDSQESGSTAMSNISRLKYLKGEIAERSTKIVSHKVSLRKAEGDAKLKLELEIQQLEKANAKDEAIREKLLAPSTPTKSESNVEACENIKKLLGIMEKAKKNRKGLIDMRNALEKADIYYDEAEVLLERDCYKNALKYIIAKDSVTSKGKKRARRVTYVGGTPGVGKTSFRFYLLWLWVNEENEWLKQFDRVHFSSSEWIYTITRDNDSFSVELLDSYKSVFHEGRPRKGLGLMELPKKLTALDKQLFGMEALILTGSPGRFQEGPELGKVVSKITYITLWEKVEAAKLVGCGVFGNGKSQLDERFELYGGVFRFLVEDDPEVLLKTALKKVTTDFIQEVLQRSVPKGNAKFLHRLVALNAEGEVVGFISEHVLKRCLYQLEQSAISDFPNLLKYAKGGYKGCVFENSVCRYLTLKKGDDQKRKLKLKDKSTITVEEVYLSYTSGGKGLKTGRLYKPWKSNFHGLDFFVLKTDTDKKNILYMLQTTISKQHSPLSFKNDDIKGLVRDVGGAKSITKIVIVYVIPKDGNFTLPNPINGDSNVTKQVKCIVGWPDPPIEGFSAD